MPVSGLVVVAVIIFGLALGELLYRRNDGATRFWGNLSQMVYALGALIIFIAAAFAGGVYLVVSFISIVLYFALFRTRWDDVSEGNVRAKIKGK